MNGCRRRRWRFARPLAGWPTCGLTHHQLGTEALGGMGGVSLMSQIIGSVVGVAYAVIAGLVVYGILRAVTGLRMSDEDQRIGADLAIHKISANPESDMMR